MELFQIICFLLLFFINNEAQKKRYPKGEDTVLVKILFWGYKIKSVFLNCLKNIQQIVALQILLIL